MVAVGAYGEAAARFGPVTMGLDVGQRRDPTAIAVAETQERDNATHHLIRHLARLPLGTTYPAVATHVAALARALADKIKDHPTLYVDATGVGQPLVDALRLADPPVRIKPVYFTHGDRRTVEGREVKLGKAWLVARLQVLLQAKRLHLPQTSEAQALAEELMNYEIRIDENANDRYGAFSTGTHDDLVTALGLACQVDHASGVVWFA